MKLSVVETSTKTVRPQRESTRHIQEALFERRWLQNPAQFNPERSARTLVEAKRLLSKLPSLVGKRALDLGTGFGHVAKTLQEAGMEVDALDIAHNALKRLHLPKVNLIQDYFPYTKLEEGLYDLVVASNLIAEIPDAERRIAISEISRLLKPSGLTLISTPIDIYSDDALLRFIQLLETELEIDELIFSYHALAITLPLFPHSQRVLALLESIGRFFWQERAISHVIALAHRRPLIPLATPVQEQKAKKSVWE